MERKKTNYIKEIFSGMDAFLALFIGALGCVFMFFIDHFQVIDKVFTSDKVSGFFSIAYNVIIIVALILIILVCLPVIAKRKVTRRDFLLIIVDSLSLTSLLVESLRGKHDTKSITFWAIILALMGIFTIVRIVCVKEQSDDKLLSKDYFGALARKYNIPLIFLFGIIFGTALGYLLHAVGINSMIAKIIPAWKNLDSFSRIGILGLIVIVLGLAALIYTFCGIRSKSKVNLFDAVLLWLMITILFTIVRLAIEYPKFNPRYFVAWLLSLSLSTFIVIIRSLFTNPGDKIESKEKTIKNYFGCLYEHYSPVLIVCAGALIALGVLYVDIVGIRSIFKTPFNGFVTVSTIALFVIAAILGLVLLIKGAIKNEKVKLFDWLLNVGLVFGIILIIDLFFKTTTTIFAIKFVSLFILLLTFVCLLIVRIKHLPAQKVEKPILYNSFVNVDTESYSYSTTEEVDDKKEVEEADEVITEKDDQETTEVITTKEETAVVASSEKNNEQKLSVDIAEKVVTDETGKVFVIRYKKSFKAKLSLADDRVQGYYDEVKNHLMSYRLSNRLSWNYESFNKGRTKCVKLNIRGKTLVMYIALDPKDYENTKYSFRTVNDSRKYADVPMMVKIKSNRGVKYAKELIDNLMSKLGLSVKDASYKDYHEEHRTFDTLLSMGLIKEVRNEKEASDDVKDEVVIENDVNNVVEESGLVINKRSYYNKLKFTSDKTKYYYDTIKNCLLSYGVKGRITRRNEVFRKSGLLAKMSISGRTIRLHLALNPNDEKFSLNRYHQFDMSSKKQYREVPFTIKVKSNLGLKRALELIEICVADRGLKAKSHFVPQDFKSDLRVDGGAIFEKLGISSLITEEASKESVKEFGVNGVPSVEEVLNLVPVKEREPISEGAHEETVYLDTVVSYLVGNEVSLESLKAINYIPLSTEKLIVKVHNSLNKKLVVVADIIDDDAAILVLKTGGSVTILK